MVFPWRNGPLEASDPTDGRTYLEAPLYERLRRFDERHSGEGQEVFRWFANSFQAQQWVGVIQLPGLQLEIIPKMDVGSGAGEDPSGRGWVEARRNLLYMLAVAGDVPIRTRDVARLATRRAPLLETLVALFAEGLLEELLRGPEGGYVGHETNLRAFKGRLVVKRQLLANAAHRERFYCAYDEFSVDTPMNRLFKAACRLLLGATSSSGTQDALRRCLLVLDDVTDAVPTAIDQAKVTFNRQNDRFATLYRFALLALAGQSPTARAGPDWTFSLLFDMNRVFERFVAAFLAARVMPGLPECQLFRQARHHRRALFETEGAGGVLSLEPDLLVQHRQSGRFLVLDTKWKRLGSTPRDGQGGIASADLYQLFAYTQRYGCAQSVLLYPEAPGVIRREFHALNEGDQRCGKRVSVRFVKVNRDLCSESERASLAQELTRLVSEGIDLALEAGRVSSPDGLMQREGVA